MKEKKSHIAPGETHIENPLIKAINDKKRIREAIWNGQDPTKLKDIKFVPYIRSRS